MNTEFAYDPRRDRWSYLWLLVGTAIGFFWSMPLATWLGPVFLLRFTRGQKVWRGILLVWLSTYLTAGYILYDILNAMMPGSLAAYLISTAVMALMVGALPYLADRLLWPRLQGFSATLVFPLAMTVVDYLGARANPLGSIGGTAYSQYGNPAVMQLLSLTGMWGITFLVSWLGPVFNWAWERGFEWKAIRRGAALYAGIMLAVFLYGSARLAFSAQPGSTVRIHGFTAVDMRGDMLPRLHAIKQQGWDAYRELSAEVQDLYFEGTLREARAGAQMVHWPEMAVMLAKEDEEAFMTRGQALAREAGIYLVMAYGVSFEDGSPFENKLTIIDPSGTVILDHFKYGATELDGAVKGDGILRTAATPFGTLSGIVCNDTNHEEVVAQAGRNGTDLLFAPSMEYRAIDPIHAHMAIYRAIENGVTLVRQADNGLSIVVDPYGRLIASTDHWTTDERVMVAQVPVSSTFSLYPYIGDLFAWLSIAGLAALVAAGIVQGRRVRHAAAAAA